MNKRPRDPSAALKAKVTKRARLLDQVRAPDSEILALTHPIAEKMASKLFEHFISLYNSEQFYMDPDCRVKIVTPTKKIEFDWVSNGDEDDGVLPSVNHQSLQKVLCHIFNDGYFKAKDRREEAIEKLTSILADMPGATLHIDNWGDDCRVRGGKIGKETNGAWVENSSDSFDESTEG